MEIETTSSSTAECNHQILKKLKFYLDKHQLRDIEEYMNDNVWNEIEQDMELKWDIMILISTRLKTLNKYRFKTFEMCQNLLIEVANRCNPKEMLLAFLAELENGTFEQDSNNSSEEDSEDDESSPKRTSKTSFDNCVKSLFTPLKIVINKIPNQKEANLKWVLGILNYHLLKIKIPDPINLSILNSIKQLNELKQPQNLTSLLRFDFLLPDYLNFLNEFVDQYSNKNFKKMSSKYIVGKMTLIKALLSLFYHPLMYLDLSIQQKDNLPIMANKCSSIDLDKHIISLTNKKDNLLSELKGVKCFKQNSQLYAFQIVNLISRLEPNIFDLYELEQLICKHNDENSGLKLTEETIKYSFGVQAYIAYVLLNESLYFVPSIYSPIYIFQQHVQYVIPLLNRTEEFVYEKGVKLAEKLIFKIPDLSLKSNFLDFLREQPLDKSLIKVMRFSAKAVHRRKAFETFKKLILILDFQGRYNFIYKTIAEPNQFNGLIGLMITIYKDFILIKHQNQEFVGSNLQNFMRLIIDKMNLVKDEFDLIENMDLLMSFLNLIRCLLIWDKKVANETGIFDEIEFINEFLNKLRRKIEFGRNFLRMKINSVKLQKNKNRSKKGLIFSIDLANGNENLSELFRNMNEEDEIAICNQGLTNIDIIDSILVRVSEILENLNKSS